MTDLRLLATALLVFAVPILGPCSAVAKGGSGGPVHSSSTSHKTSTQANRTARKGLPWHDVKAGFSLAKRTKKIVLIDFFTDWCQFCKVMDEQTYEDPQLAKLLSRFVLVKANAEDGGAGQSLARQFSVNGYPTTCFTDAKGKVLGVAVGFRDPAQMTLILNTILEGKPLPRE